MTVKPTRDCPGRRSDRNLGASGFCDFCGRMYRPSPCANPDGVEAAQTLAALARATATLRTKHGRLLNLLQEWRDRRHEEGGEGEFDASEEVRPESSRCVQASGD